MRIGPHAGRLPLELLLLLLAVGCRGGGELQVHRGPTALPANLPRLSWHPLVNDGVSRVSDFVLAHDTLTVLDALGHRVVHLTLRDGEWHESGAFGRRGAGPGELQRPRALARAHDSLLAVIEDGGRIQLFTRGGRYLRAEREPLPCPMFAPTLAYGEGELRFVAGNCPGPGTARDTVFTVLLRARGDGAYETVARAPRMALDLSWGSSFATMRPLSSDHSGFYFGTGLAPCAERFGRDGESSGAACGLARELLTAPLPEKLARLQDAARRRGDERMLRALRWPATLPVYFAVLGDGDVTLLARPIGSDSLVLHPAGVAFDPALARLVAPMQGFVGCSDATCLWYDDATHSIALHSGRNHAR